EFLIMFPPNFVIVMLDTDCMAREMLPALMKRHFAEGEESNYVAAVTGRNPQRLIFQLATMDFDPSTADASANFFRLRADDPRNLPGNRILRILSPNFRGRSDRRLAGDKLPDTQIMPVVRVAAPEANEQDGLWRLHLRHRSG